MQNKYKVVLTGNPVGGVSRESAITAFARFAKISREKAAEVFARVPSVIKRDVTRDVAETYQRKLASMGVGAEVQSEESSAAGLVGSAGTQAPRTASAQGENAGEIPTRAAHTQQTKKAVGPAASSAAGSGGGSATPPPTSPPQAGSGSAGQKRHVGFVFSGEGYEYFKIWIVNILLTIVTLGLYAPWAKVRNTQYFYGNTSLENASFAFTADPVKMLIGRLIALGILLAVIAAGFFLPGVGLVLGLALVFVFPWVVNRTLKFYARNTTYRNIRFRFVGTYGKALAVFLGWPLLAALTFGLLSPYAMYKQQRFFAENHRYGNKSFNFTARPGDYYVLFVISIVIVLVGFLVFIMGGAAAALASGAGALAALGGLGLALSYAASALYFMTGMQNLLYNNLTLSSHDFKSNYQVMSYGVVMGTNFLFTLLTLGLFIPWAKVRLARYAAEHTAVDVAEDLDKFAAISQPDESAFGEEFGDVFDMDVAF